MSTVWKPAGGLRFPRGPTGRGELALRSSVYVSLRVWLGSLSPITKWLVFRFQCGWSKVTDANGQRQLLFTETPINYSQYVSVNISASQCSRPVHCVRLAHAIDSGKHEDDSPLHDPTLQTVQTCTNVTHTPIKPIKMHIDPFIKRSTNKISRGRVAVLRGNYLYLCIFLTRWLSHLISFIHCCTNEWSFVLVVDLFSLNNRVFLFDSHRTNASPRKIVMNSCEVRLDLLSIYIHINVLVIPKVAVC